MVKKQKNYKGKDNYWLLYYLIIGIIQVSWTSLNSFPPFPFRVAIILAAFGPLLFRPQFIPMAFMFNITVNRYLATEYTYLPTDINLYLVILIPLFFLHRKYLKNCNTKYLKFFIFMAMYWAVIDLINVGDLGIYVKFCIVPILSCLFIRDERTLHLYSAGFIMACTLLSVYYYVNFDRFSVTWNVTEGLERSGWCDPNYFSTTLGTGYMFCLLYLFGILKSSLVIFRPLILVACSFFITLAVIMLASRAGFICLLVITAVLLFKSQIKVKWTILALCTMVATGFYLFINGVFDLLLYRLFEQGNVDSAGNRTEIWESVFAGLYNQPFFYTIFGGGYWHRVSLTGGMETHNEFLAICADYGLIGLVFYVTLLLSLLSKRSVKSKIVNIPLLFYVLITLSLSPFQYPCISFLITWICSAKVLLRNNKLTLPSLSTSQLQLN